MTNEELDMLSEEDRYLVTGIEDGWIDPTDEDLERYYQLTGLRTLKTLLIEKINRLSEDSENDIRR